jgi:hypothetical protein
MPDPTWRPSVADVAVFMHARTVNDDGEEVGTFTADTTPTATQVGEKIDLAMRLLRPRLGTPPAELEETANAIVALRAACLVELGHFPSDVENENGVYRECADMLKEALASYELAREGDTAQQGSPRSGSLRIGTLLSGL